ncbi:MAG: hypothetical protein C5B55_04695 [Blastocatellia bacterium]|nr:MAG: hypothetical protein C5B55_04695 [Blastocatellia bacterium]
MTTKKIILIVVGVLVALGLLILVFVGGIIGIAFYTVSHSQAAVTAKDFLHNNEKLKSDIGDVKDFGNLVTGSVNINNDRGEATINLKVYGEKKTVNASVNLVYVNGQMWRVSSATYVNEKGTTVNLLDPYESKRYRKQSHWSQSYRAYTASVLHV